MDTDSHKDRPSEVEESAGRIRTLITAAEILEALSENPPPVRVNQLTKELGMTKTRISRHLLTLRDLGFIERVEGGEGYRLGWKIFQLGQTAASHNSMVEIGITHINKLRDALQETAILVSPADGHGMVLASANSHKGVTVLLNPGSLLTLPTSPAARAMLAFSTEEHQERVLSGLFGTDSDEYRFVTSKLPEIRGRFYDYGEGARGGVGGTAAPVFDINNDVCGAVSVIQFLSQPENDQWADADVIRAVVDCASDISRSLGSTYNYHQRT